MIRNASDYTHPGRVPDITFVTDNHQVTHSWWLINQTGGITYFKYTTSGFSNNMLTRARLSPEGLFYHHPDRREERWEPDNEDEVIAHLNKFLTKVDNILIGDGDEC